MEERPKREDEKYTGYYIGDTIMKQVDTYRYSLDQDKYIDKLEAENKELNKVIIDMEGDESQLNDENHNHINDLNEEIIELKEKIKRVEDSLMDDEELDVDNTFLTTWEVQRRNGAKHQKDLTLKALER